MMAVLIKYTPLGFLKNNYIWTETFDIFNRFNRIRINYINLGFGRLRTPCTKFVVCA
jgi:hypothetical protein